MALIAGSVQRGRLLPLFVAAVTITVGNYVFAQCDFAAPAFAPIRMASLESVLILFMLIGVLFNYHLRGLLRLPGLLGSIAAMLVLFAAAWRCSAMRAEFPLVTGQYILGLALFGLAYAARRHAVRVAILDWLAAISFPLYLIHLVIGVSTLKWLMLETGMAYLPALAISFAVTIGLATLLHRGIERQSTAWGSRLAVIPSAA